MNRKLKTLWKNQKGDGVSIFSLVLIPILLVFSGIFIAMNGYDSMGEKQSQNLADNIAFFIASQGVQTEMVVDGVEYRACVIDQEYYEEWIGDPTDEDYGHETYGPAIKALTEGADGYHNGWQIEIYFIEDETVEDGVRKDSVRVEVSYILPRIYGFRDETFQDHYDRLYDGSPTTSDILGGVTHFSAISNTVSAETQCID